MGIKKNFAYNSILTASNYIIPLIVFPYISRILGVENIGICNFVDSVINYYILFSMMGINLLGIREISCTKQDKNKLNQVFNTLFCLNGFFVLTFAIILTISIFIVPQFSEYQTLMFVGLFKLIFNFLLIEWLYQGLENFKYITVRSILVKLLYVIAIFLFVKRKENYYIYYILTTLCIVVNALFNIVYSRHFINFQLSHWKSKLKKKYYKPFFTFGLQALMTSMYTSFNIAYLGFISTKTEVGYYSTAIKIQTIILAFYSAFTNTMLPRMSALIAEGKYDDFKKKISQSVNLLLMIGMPILIYVFIYAKEIILLISGLEYTGAIIPMKIVIPLLIIIGYEQIIILQVLIPLHKDKEVLINSVIGAIVGILLNILLVNKFASIGSAVVWCVSEICVLLSGQYFVYKFMKIKFPIKPFIKYLTVSIPIIIINYILYYCLELSLSMKLFIGALSIIAYYYIVYVRILKDTITVTVINKIEFIFNKRLYM